MPTCFRSRCPPDRIELDLGSLLTGAPAEALLAVPTTCCRPSSVKQQLSQEEADKQGIKADSGSNWSGKLTTFCDCSRLIGLLPAASPSGVAITKEQEAAMANAHAARQALLSWTKENGSLPLLEEGGEAMVRFRMDPANPRVGSTSCNWLEWRVALPSHAGAMQASRDGKAAKVAARAARDSEKQPAKAANKAAQKKK